MPGGQKVNKAGLSGVFGVSLVTVETWIRQGCPVESKGAGKGKPWVFDTKDVSDWLRERDKREAGGQDVQDDAALTKRRKLAETRLVEIELLEKMGELAPVSQMERVWSRLLAELQGGLRGAFIMRCVTQLLGETDERTFKRVLLGEVDNCLTELSEIDLSEPDEDADDDAA